MPTDRGTDRETDREAVQVSSRAATMTLFGLVNSVGNLARQDVHQRLRVFGGTSKAFGASTSTTGCGCSSRPEMEMETETETKRDPRLSLATLWLTPNQLCVASTDASNAFVYAVASSGYINFN